MIEFHFFWNVNKNFRVAGKNRVSQVTGNTHIFWPYFDIEEQFIFHARLKKVL